jgi:hypothetical protein
MSGNAFVTLKNHYLMPATRSVMLGKHFVMLGNGFAMQKFVSALDNILFLDNRCQKHGQIFYTRMR